MVGNARYVAFALVVLAILSSGLVRADPIAKARDEFKKGETAYAVRDFKKAVIHYKKAYELSKRPALLFNVAQAHKLAGNLKEAIYFYDTYLRLSRKPANRADVERYIVELKEKQIEADRRSEDARKKQEERDLAERERKRLEAEAKAREAREREAQAQAQLARAQALGGPQRRPSPGLKLAGLVTLGVGLAATGTGLYLNLKAKSDFDELNSVERWTVELDDKRDSADSARKLGIIATSVGGAAVVAGAVLYFLGRRGTVVEDSSVAIAPSDGGVTMTIAGRF